MHDAGIEDRYRALFETSRDAIMTLEPPSWAFTCGNPACIAMFRTRDEADFTSRAPWELSSASQPDGRPSDEKAREMIEIAMREGSHFFEWTHRRTDGEEFPATVLLSRMETDGKAFLQATVRDITEMKRAQTQIESLHRRNEIIMNSAGEGIYGVDLKGDTTFVNRAALKLLGYTQEELIGKPQHALIHHTRPDGRPYPADECPVYAAFTDGRVHHVTDDVFWRKDGTSFRVEYIGNPMHDEHGALIGAVVTFNDITARKRVEAQLRLQVAAMEATTEAILITDRVGIITWVNAAFTLMTGYAPADIVGQPASILVPEGQPDATYQDIQNTLLAGKVWKGELLNRRKDGALYPEEISITPVYAEGGAVTHQVALKRDITERKRQEAELRETHQILEGILGTIPVRVFWKDRNLVYQGCNRVFARDAGLADPKDIIGKDDFQMVWRAQAELYRADDSKVIASGRPRLLIEEPQTTPGGDTIWLLTSKVPLQNSEGEVLGVLGTYMDVTERKRAEAERLELEKQLQDKQKLAAIGTLACGMGHEINNPIMGIINYAQLIKDRLQGKDANVEEFADEIAIEAERIAGIVRGLNTFASRGTASHLPMAISDLVESAVTATRDTLARVEITLEVNLPDSLPVIPCDRAQITQVLTSLIGNACDALNDKYPDRDDDKVIVVSAELFERGSEETVLTSATPSSDFRVPRSGSRILRLTVEDHGTGIPDAVREHIFEPFFTTKDRSVGVGSVGKGLGLFVSYAVVQEHGGELTVESEPGNWTRFHIDLPAVPADVPQAQTLQAGLPVNVVAAVDTTETGG